MSYIEFFWFNSNLLHGGEEVNKGKGDFQGTPDPTQNGLLANFI